MKRNISNKNNADKNYWLTIIPWIISSGLILFIVQQYYFKSNKRTENLIQLQKEVVKENYALYNKVMLWTYLNTQLDSSVIINDIVGKYEEENSITITLPQNSITLSGNYDWFIKFSIDTSFNRECEKITNEIYTERTNIDISLYEKFDYLAKYKQQHMISTTSSYSELKKSGWSYGEEMLQWISLNISLRKEVEDFTKLKTNIE